MCQRRIFFYVLYESKTIKGASVRALRPVRRNDRYICGRRPRTAAERRGTKKKPEGRTESLLEYRQALFGEKLNSELKPAPKRLFIQRRR